MQIPRAEIVILIPEELVRAVGAQPRRASQEKLRHTDIIRAEGRAALSHDE